MYLRCWNVSYFSLHVSLRLRMRLRESISSSLCLHRISPRGNIGTILPSCLPRPPSVQTPSAPSVNDLTYMSGPLLPLAFPEAFPSSWATSFRSSSLRFVNMRWVSPCSVLPSPRRRDSTLQSSAKAICDDERASTCGYSHWQRCVHTAPLYRAPAQSYTIARSRRQTCQSFVRMH